MGRAFEVRKASMMKTGLAKAKIYSRYSKEIYIAAKNGGPDPEANLTLKRLIEKAKKEQVPQDVIKRAIDKVNSGSGENYKENQYEGFGPSGATILVNCLTDNDNRTISDVKTAFKKTDNKLGVSGSVNYQYDYLGVISLKNTDEDSVMELMLENDLDAKDIETEDGLVTVYVDPNDFHHVSEVISSKFEAEDIEMDEITYIPQATVSLEGEDKESFQKLIDMLNECDDVQNLYHNVDNL